MCSEYGKSECLDSVYCKIVAEYSTAFVAKEENFECSIDPTRSTSPEPSFTLLARKRFNALCHFV